MKRTDPPVGPGPEDRMKMTELTDEEIEEGNWYVEIPLMKPPQQCTWAVYTEGISTSS